MLQPMLLLEFLLLAATVYFFWQTRRVAGQSADASTPKADYLDERATIELAQEMTELLAELQSVAEVMRREAQTHQSSLHQAIDQAEAAQAKLQTLIEQVNVDKEVIPVSDGSKVRLADSGKQSRNPTFFDVLDAYSTHLAATAHSDRAIARTISHAREFAIWLGGPYYDELRLNQIDSAKMTAYLSDLEAQHHRPAAIKRIRSSLEAFVNWLEQFGEGQFSKINRPVEPQDNVVSSPSPAVRTISIQRYEPAPLLAVQADTLVGRNRFQSALELAKQGLDQRSIAAQTGLAQEAVRMLLAREQAA